MADLSPPQPSEASLEPGDWVPCCRARSGAQLSGGPSVFLLDTATGWRPCARLPVFPATPVAPPPSGGRAVSSAIARRGQNQMSRNSQGPRD